MSIAGSGRMLSLSGIYGAYPRPTARRHHRTPARLWKPLAAFLGISCGWTSRTSSSPTGWTRPVRHRQPDAHRSDAISPTSCPAAPSSSSSIAGICPTPRSTRATEPSTSRPQSPLMRLTGNTRSCATSTPGLYELRGEDIAGSSGSAQVVLDVSRLTRRSALMRASGWRATCCASPRPRPARPSSPPAPHQSLRALRRPAVRAAPRPWSSGSFRLTTPMPSPCAWRGRHSGAVRGRRRRAGGGGHGPDRRGVQGAVVSLGPAAGIRWRATDRDAVGRVG